MELNAEREQITSSNNDLYDYVKRIVAAVKYKGEGDHEDVPRILRMFAKGYEQRIKELTEENERLQDLVKEVQEYNEAWVKDNHDLRAENERLRADTLENIKIEFAMRFGTYTDKDQVKITDVFTLLDQIAKEMLN